MLFTARCAGGQEMKTVCLLLIVWERHNVKEYLCNSEQTQIKAVHKRKYDDCLMVRGPKERFPLAPDTIRFIRHVRSALMQAVVNTHVRKLIIRTLCADMTAPYFWAKALSEFLISTFRPMTSSCTGEPQGQASRNGRRPPSSWSSEKKIG